MEAFTLNRTGQPPLKFKGVLLGEGTDKTHNSTRWNWVYIYRTAGGKYIAYIKAVTQWEGESTYLKGQSLATAKDVIDYLQNEEGNLGEASQDAVENAAVDDEGIKAAWAENVD